ncbi:MAG: hypothetical protein K2I95_03440 [Treponemataceae bacterium]|nr:hypothetical protein [Treponemataceae bacterium]
MKCSCGKKFFAPALFAAAILAATAFALFACGGGDSSSGDSYISGNFGTGESGIGGGDNTGNEGENQGGENENESGGNDEQTEKIANVSDVLKLVMGESEYNKIYNESGKFAPTEITLTAQTIKDVGNSFSGLSTYIGQDKEKDTISSDHQQFIKNNKKIVVAQAKGLINITKSGNKYTFNYGSSELSVKFTGEFNLSNYSLPDNNGKGDFDNATLTNNGESISINVLNNIRGSYSPKLIFTNIQKVLGIEGSKAVYELYKDYSEKLGNLKIKGDLASIPVNGKNISDNSSNYTLFNDNDTAKSSSDTSVKSLTINVMVQMYNQLGIQKFLNMIISGTAEEATVNWNLTNIVFEGDMSKIKNTGSDITGIVYFNDKVYNAPAQNLKGLLKLNNIEGVSGSTLGVRFASANYNVLDVRGVNTSSINSYNKDGILIGGGYAHAIYFSDYYSSYKDNETKIKELCLKFSNNQAAGFINAYLGNTRVNGESYSQTNLNKDYSTIGAKTPRSLKEFEAFGNNNEYKFEKAARDTYDNDELSDFDKNKLNFEPYRIAQTNKRCFSCVAKNLV